MDKQSDEIDKLDLINELISKNIKSFAFFIENIDFKLAEYIMDEDKISSLVESMMLLINNKRIDFNDAQKYRFQASKLEIKFIRYKDQKDKTLTFYRSVERLAELVDDLYEIL